jgi:hypothetical protein
MLRLFTAFFILVGTLSLVIVVGKIVAQIWEIKIAKRKLRLLERKLDFNMIRELDTDGDGIDKFEFVFGILYQIG